MNISATLIDHFVDLGVEIALISGDLTTTSQKKEFLLARIFTETMALRQIRVIAVPGNHDHYTKRAWQHRVFYRYFPAYEEHGWSLAKEGVAHIPLDATWSLIALDTARATSIFSSHGVFTERMEVALENVLTSIPHEKKILLLNHFPLFAYDTPGKELLGAERLRRSIQKDPRICLYLHGHSHRHTLADLRPSGLPILADSGSVSLVRGGAWNFFTLSYASCTCQCFHQNQGKWVPFQQKSFAW